MTRNETLIKNAFKIPNLLAIGAKMNTCKNMMGTATIPVAMPSWSVEKPRPSRRGSVEAQIVNVSSNPITPNENIVYSAMDFLTSGIQSKVIKELFHNL